MARSFLLLLLCPISGWAWIAVVTKPAFRASPATTVQWMSAFGELGGPPTDPELPSGDDPCWQDLYDDDCVMSKAMAANFVASKWIKSMPCAEGIEDCDMPEKLQAPSIYGKQHGIESVDVRDFLGLKVAKAIDAKSEEGKENTGMKP